MKLKMWGTRGSIPISNPASVHYGGNTTCIEILSGCIPEGEALVVDTGSGYVPFSFDALKRGIDKVTILQSHHHHDHNQGFPLSPLTHMKDKEVHIFGPVQDSAWTMKKVLESIMQKPLFPVSYCLRASHIHTHDLEYPQTQVVLIHPRGGLKRLQVDAFERLIEKDSPMPFARRETYPLEECLLITMHISDHPEATISYRFDEKPTGKVCVVLLDHENQAGFPLDLVNHLQGADLLLQDVQYDPETYQTKTSGFGHGSSDYATALANRVGIKRQGYLHHDPRSTDEKVDQIVQIGRDLAQRAIDDDEILEAPEEIRATRIQPENIFACADYQTIEV